MIGWIWQNVWRKYLLWIYIFTGTCGAGTELSVLGICEPCVLGTYKPGDNQDSCQSCPYGYSTPQVGAISVHQCSVGKYLGWNIVQWIYGFNTISFWISACYMIF